VDQLKISTIGYRRYNMNKKIIFRNCPICKCEVGYTTKEQYLIAEKNNSYCKNCRSLKLGIKQKIFFRTCYTCGRKLGYTNKKAKNQAEKLNLSCGKCACKEAQNRPEVIKKDLNTVK
jgi:hypothetical protein